MRDLTVQSNGLHLRLIEFSADGPPLLLVHGTGMAAGVWEPVAAHLPGYRVLALDRRGHGDSDKPATSYGFNDDAADIAAVITALGIEGCAAIGHSSGGTALIVCAAKHPEVLSRVVAIDPIIFPARAVGAPSPMVERTRGRRARWGTAREMFDLLHAKFPFDGWTDEAMWAYVRHGARELPDGSVELKCPPEIEARIYLHAGDADLFGEILPRLTTPTLIVRGERTDRFSPENAARARDTNRSVTLVEMPGVTHFAPMEQPEAVAARALRFLRAEDVTPGRRIGEAAK